MKVAEFKQKLEEVVFGTDTPLGKFFDVLLLWAICLSVIAVMWESSISPGNQFKRYLYFIEWLFTILFTVEYLVRIWISPSRRKYIFSFYGVVDLLSVLPSYLALILPGATYLLIIRLLRVMRIFRVLKMIRFLQEADVLVRSLWLSRRKILIFFSMVAILSTIFGSVMYVVEGPANGFTSIPRSIYWTIVTITTVGYGDITPQSPLGQFIASLAMLTGYSIIAVPTGIITAELAQEINRERIGRSCKNCGGAGHDRDAVHCKFCGAKLAG